MTIRGLWMRLRALLRPATVERELDEEIRFHLEQEAALLSSNGVDDAEARRRARVAFGGVERAKEIYRDGRGDRLLSDARSDLRYGLRVLGRYPTLTATVILTLALGMGANVAIFSAVNAVMLRPPPFAEPGQLVALWEDNDLKGWKGSIAAPANMLDWQEQVRAFDGVAGWTDFDVTSILTGAGDPVALRTSVVTGGFFSVLGVSASLGRVFEERETWQSAQRIAVLSHRIWRERFQADPAVVGRTIRLDGNAVEIVGVMGEGFNFPARHTDVWLPMRWALADRQQVWFRRGHWVRPFARLRPGVREEEARVQLTTVMRALEQRYPETNVGMEADLGSLQDFLVGSSRRPLLVLLSATAFLLLIACANVGNLLLVRAAAREREIVMRRALGAGRWRIARQALTESALLAVGGGAAGLALGWWGTRVLASLQPEGLLPVTNVQPDLRVVGVVAVACAVSAALFGTVPAVWAAQRSAAEALKEATRGTSTGRRTRAWIGTLAVSEVALAVMLSIGATLLLRSYRELTMVHPGFEAAGVSATSLVLPESRYASGEQIAAFYDLLLERARALPGVQGAALTTVLPLTSAGWTSDFTIRGRGSDGTGREVRHRQVSPDYFRLMKVPVIAGRSFGREDVVRGEPVVLINQAMAERYFAGRDPVGEYVASDLVPDSTSVWRRIVGVVGNEHGKSLGVTPGLDLIEPIFQDRSNHVHLVVRSAIDAGTLFRSIETSIAALDPGLAPSSTTTMEDLRRRALASDRFLAVLLSAFAIVGALLAVVGVYGVVAQAALRRIPEMGIRLALGADAGGVRWLIVRHGLSLTVTGVGLGVIGAALLNGAVRTMLFRISPLDPLTFLAVAGLLVVTGAIAAWIPARRVTRGSALGTLLR